MIGGAVGGLLVGFGMNPSKPEPGSDTTHTQDIVLCTSYALIDAALQIPFLSRVLLRAANSADLPASHPTQEKLKSASGAAAFVCIGSACSLPVTEPAAIAASVVGMKG